MENLKTCNKCGVEKPATEKYFKGYTSSSKLKTRLLAGQCLQCLYKYERNRYHSDSTLRTNRNIRVAKWKKENMGKVITYNKSPRGRENQSKATKKYYRLHINPNPKVRYVNPFSKKEYLKLYMKKYVEDLPEAYIKQLIKSGSSSLDIADIPQELIESKRVTLQLKRHIGLYNNYIPSKTY